MKKKLILIVLIISSILLTSCSDKNTTLFTDKSVKEESADITKKYNSYVEASNIMNDVLNQSLNYYYKSFGLDINNFEPEEKAFVTSSVSSFNVDLIQEKLSFYDNEPIIENLDSAAKNLEPTIVELANIINDIKIYYDSKSYVDDDFKEGRELHTKLCTSYENYYQKKETFFVPLMELSYEESEKAMENYLKNNELIKYHSIDYMVTALDLFTELKSQNIDNENPTVDSGKFAEQYKILSEKINELVDAVNNSKNEEINQFEQSNFNKFISYTQETKGAAAQISQDLNEGNLSIKSLNEFYKNYRTMIHYYNRVVQFSNNIDNLNYFPVI
jgi:hypothetical protein